MAANVAARPAPANANGASDRERWGRAAAAKGALTKGALVVARGACTRADPAPAAGVGALHLAATARLNDDELKVRARSALLCFVWQRALYIWAPAGWDKGTKSARIALASRRACAISH